MYEKDLATGHDDILQQELERNLKQTAEAYTEVEQYNYSELERPMDQSAKGAL